MTHRGIQIQVRTAASALSSRIIHDNKEYPIYSTSLVNLLFILSITTGIDFEQNGERTPCTYNNPPEVSQIRSMPGLILRNCSIKTVSNADLYGNRVNDVIERGLFLISGDGDQLQLGLLNPGVHSPIDLSNQPDFARTGYLPHVFNKIWGIPKGCAGFSSDRIKALQTTIVDSK